MPGVNLLPTFAKDVAVKRESIWWLHEGNRAIRVGDWKIVAAGKGSAWELYDLKADRSETKNLAASLPDRVRELEFQWNQLTTTFTNRAAKDPPTPKTPKAPKK